MTIADRINEMMDMLPPAEGRSGWPWSLDGADLPDGDVRVGELPRITIITSSFNRADFIEETLRGVLLRGIRISSTSSWTARVPTVSSTFSSGTDHGSRRSSANPTQASAMP